MINQTSKILQKEFSLMCFCERNNPVTQTQEDEFESYNYDPIQYFKERAIINRLVVKKLEKIIKKSDALIKKVEKVDLKNDIEEASNILSALHELKLSKDYKREISNLYEEKMRRSKFDRIDPILESFGLQSLSLEELLTSLNSFRSYNAKLIEAIKAVYKADKIKLLEILK